MFSLKFFTNPLWQTTSSFKSESYSLQHCIESCRILDFAGIFRTTTYENHVWTARFAFALINKCNRPLVQESEMNISY